MSLVFIMLFNIMQNQVLSLQEKVDLDTMIRDAESVLTGTGMAHRIEHHGTKHMRYRLEQQTTTMINCDVVMSRFPIVSSRRLTIGCNRDVFEGKYSCIENKDGNRTELVLQSNVYGLKAKLLERKADSKWLSDINSVEMRTLEDQAKPN